MYAYKHTYILDIGLLEQQKGKSPLVVGFITTTGLLQQNGSQGNRKGVRVYKWDLNALFLVLLRERCVDKKVSL